MNPKHKPIWDKIVELEDILGMRVPRDGLMMIVCQKPIIDIIELDKKLMKEHDYEGSMKDFVQQKFGDRAVELLKELNDELRI